MKKIPTLFERDQTTKLVLPIYAVIITDALATVKIDGTACMIRSHILYKRYDAKSGRITPINFEPVQEKADAITGHWPGWIPVGDGPEDQWHREAFDINLLDGTYELIGPKVQHNPYHLDQHKLIRHGIEILDNVPIDFAGLQVYLSEHEIEGIVWWKNSEPFCKIKRRDFGLKWPI